MKVVRRRRLIGLSSTRSALGLVVAVRVEEFIGEVGAGGWILGREAERTGRVGDSGGCDGGGCVVAAVDVLRKGVVSFFESC